MELKSQIMNKVNEECCPKFNPAKWDEKNFEWKEKKFIKASVPTFFHIPFSPMLGKKITNVMKIAEDAQKLSASKDDILLLFSHPHPFKSELYLSVTGPVPDIVNCTISGKYLSKVFDGEYKKLPSFIKEMEVDLNSQNKKAKKYYVHYAYCPKCAKDFGHNYMVLFADITS
jgi:hypothetical protein